MAVRRRYQSGSNYYWADVSWVHDSTLKRGYYANGPYYLHDIQSIKRYNNALGAYTEAYRRPIHVIKAKAVLITNSLSDDIGSEEEHCYISIDNHYNYTGDDYIYLKITFEQPVVMDMESYLSAWTDYESWICCRDTANSHIFNKYFNGNKINEPITIPENTKTIEIFVWTSNTISHSLYFEMINNTVCGLVLSWN